MTKKLTYFAIKHPRIIIALTLLFTVLFLFQFPKAHIDTDPENMLEENQVDRVFYDQVKEDFGISDMIVLGISNETGVFQTEFLHKLSRIINGILQIDGIIVEDVISFTTTDNVISENGVLQVHRIMETVPETQEELAHLKSSIYENPLFVEKIVSRDGNSVAIYLPIEQKDMSVRISGEIETLLAMELGEEQKYYIAGLPVAEDTFGSEMFLQMGILAPLARDL